MIVARPGSPRTVPRVLRERKGLPPEVGGHVRLRWMLLGARGLLVGLAGPLAVGGLAGPAGLHAQTWKTVTATRQVTDEDDLRVRVEYGAGVLAVRRGDTGLLYGALLQFDADHTAPRTEYEGGRLVVGLSPVRPRGIDPDDWSSETSLELELAPGLPIDLDMNFGAGRAEVDLTGLSLRRLEVNTGASESVIRMEEVNPEPMESAEINVGAADLRVLGVGNLNAERLAVKSGLGSVVLRLDGQWPQDAVLHISMGVGALDIRIPRSLGVRLRRPGSFLASIDTEGLEKRGDFHQSANWDSAGRKVEIEIAAVLGSVDIEWIP